MQKTPPSTPANVLEVSSPLLKLIAQAVTKTAEVCGCWRSPYKNAKTTTEDMTLLDMLYWTYKCTNPVIRPERGESCPIRDNASSLTLPKGFEKHRSITLGVAGDLLNTEFLESSKDTLFENIADLLFEQTVSFANFESSITEQPLIKEIIGDKGPPIECCSRHQFDILKGYKNKNFTVLNTANNHKFDMGIEGIETTKSVLHENGILEIGTNRRPEEAGQGRILLSDGIKLGWAAATFGLNGRKMPNGEEYRINIAKVHSAPVEDSLAILKRQIDHCKSENCDFIVVSLHWGYEFEFFPRAQQVALAHELVEYGADIIIAHHPHVIQPIEYYRTQRDPNRMAVIAYSLGSLTWGFFAPHLALSTILNLKLSKGRMKDHPSTYIEHVEITPVFRRAFEQDGKLKMSIEKLSNWLNRSCQTCVQSDVMDMRRYAETVIGPIVR